MNKSTLAGAKQAHACYALNHHLAQVKGYDPQLATIESQLATSNMLAMASQRKDDNKKSFCRGIESVLSLSKEVQQ